MKFVYFVGVLFFQGALANPLFFDVGPNIVKGFSDAAAGIANSLPFGGDNTRISIPDIVGNGIKGAINKTEEIGLTATKMVENAIKMGANTMRNGVDAATNVRKAIESGVQNVAKRMADVVKRANQIRSAILKRAIENSKRPIEAAQVAIKIINNIAQNRMVNSMKKINDTIDAQNRLKDWADEQKSLFESTSEETKQKANEEIDKFVQAREKETQMCAKNIIEPMQERFDASRKFTESGLPALHNILNEIEKCIDEPKTLTIMGNCARNIRKNASTLRNIPRRAEDLKRLFAGTAADQIFNAPCIAETRIKIEKGRAALQKKLDDLLASDDGNVSTTKQPAETTTEAASESTATAGAETTTDSGKTTTESASESTATEGAETTTEDGETTTESASESTATEGAETTTEGGETTTESASESTATEGTETIPTEGSSSTSPANQESTTASESEPSTAESYT